MDGLLLSFALAGIGAPLESTPNAKVGTPARKIDYVRDVRPILSGNCFQCHGPDDKARKARLRLDERDGAVKELPSGNRAIVPGKPNDSEVLVRLNTTDDQ